MLESIYIGMSGLLGYSRGLKVIANNTANMNTPGFKSSTLQFADLFYSTSNLADGHDGANFRQVGYGLNTLGTTLSFKQGDLRQSSNPLDLAIDGLGMFTLQDAQGNLTYTRAGQFEFNSSGVLVNKSDGLQVMGLNAGGALVPISLSGLQVSSAQATSTISFSGNLSSTATDQTVNPVTVIDHAGTSHTLSLKFTNTSTGTDNTWNMELLDGTTVIGTQPIAFVDGKPTAATAKPTFTYSLAGQAPIALTLDLSTDVTSFASGGLSTLAMNSQNGVGPGALVQTTFDDTGALTLTYGNGRVLKSARLALARFDSLDAVEQVGDNQFRSLNDSLWHTGYAGADGFGSLRSSTLEIANVDLSQQFSDLVIMQRGYQSSSQVISTANEMLQELFGLKK